MLSFLEEESLNDLLHIAFSRVTVKNFNPELAIELWWIDVIKLWRLVNAYRPKTKGPNMLRRQIDNKTHRVSSISLLLTIFQSQLSFKK